MRSGPILTFFLLILGFLSLIFFLGSHAAVGEGEQEPPLEIGELVIENATENFTGITVILNGNITIGEGGELILENTEIQVNSTNVSRYSIHVEEGGILEMTNSRLTRNSSFGYDIEIEGNLSMENCTITGMNDANRMDDSGMYIRSSNVLMNGSTITNWGFVSKAVTINNSSPIIRNCILSAQYFGAFLVNGASPVFMNTTFTTPYNSGIGLLCNDSSFHIENCNFTDNYYGIDIHSGKYGDILNSVFMTNRIGIIMSEDSGMTPLVTGCLLEGNKWCGIFLYGNATVENCIFLHNGAPTPTGQVAAAILMESDQHSNFSISNSTFLENHNGILFSTVSIMVKNCSFENNTLLGGTTGVIIFYPRKGSLIDIRESTFTGNPMAIEVVYANTSAIIGIHDNLIQGSWKGILSWNSTLEIRNNNFKENEVALEDRYRKSSKIINNTYENNTIRYRYTVRIEVHIRDGYGIDLEGASLSIVPRDSIGNYSLDMETDEIGDISADIIWQETAAATVHYYPYTLTAAYQGAEEIIKITDPGIINHTLIVPFLRPNLTLSDLKIDSQRSSLLGEKTRENERSYIEFTVKNIGEGEAREATVTVRAGDRLIAVEHVSLEPGKEKEFRIKWTPASEGKINISVKVSHPNELNVSENSLVTRIDIGDDQRGYYYLSILITILVISALIWWMAGNIEGADEDMAEFSRKIKKWLSGLFDSWARMLSVDDIESYDDAHPFIPIGDIYSWNGEPTMSGSGKFLPWSIDDENLLRARKKDIITVHIKIPLPEPEIIEVVPKMETFEWVTGKGKKESIKVDKRTITKISHPKMFICSLCDRNFVSVGKSAKCPWCAGKAYFLQEM